MGTKNNPGKFDCFNAAEPDEPLFVLLARDRMAPFLVSIWSKVRAGDVEAANYVYKRMMAEIAYGYAVKPDVEKSMEANECSQDMFEWRAANR